jgi:hypothetical protein
MARFRRIRRRWDPRLRSELRFELLNPGAHSLKFGQNFGVGVFCALGACVDASGGRARQVVALCRTWILCGRYQQNAEGKRSDTTGKKPFHRILLARCCACCCLDCDSG